MCITAASGGSLLFDQYRPFAFLQPKNRKTGKGEKGKPIESQGAGYFPVLATTLLCRGSLHLRCTCSGRRQITGPPRPGLLRAARTPIP
jgi:hypothetical protein